MMGLTISDFSYDHIPGADGVELNVAHGGQVARGRYRDDAHDTAVQAILSPWLPAHWLPPTP